MKLGAKPSTRSRSKAAHNRIGWPHEGCDVPAQLRTQRCETAEADDVAEPVSEAKSLESDDKHPHQ